MDFTTLPENPSISCPELHSAKKDLLIETFYPLIEEEEPLDAIKAHLEREKSTLKSHIGAENWDVYSKELEILKSKYYMDFEPATDFLFISTSDILDPTDIFTFEKRKKKRKRQEDLTYKPNKSIPLKSNALKVVFCFNVFRFIENLENFLADIKRLLNNSGYLIIVENLCKTYADAYKLDMYDYLTNECFDRNMPSQRTFSPEKYKMVITSFGFESIYYQEIKKEYSPTEYFEVFMLKKVGL